MLMAANIRGGIDGPAEAGGRIFMRATAAPFIKPMIHARGSAAVIRATCPFFADGGTMGRAVPTRSPRMMYRRPGILAGPALMKF